MVKLLSAEPVIFIVFSKLVFNKGILIVPKPCDVS